ncbi:lysophospholipid acyltransferase family protein [Thalassolituus sp. LLYu03]|uniref:lysophospholipid acyltransferase family protein n=1 Tax=Thalassolituus sp. LLYu03 TaxID=3421656 RepID=UPI003D29B9E3
MNSLFGYLMIGLVKLLGLIPLAQAQAVGRAIGWALRVRRTRSREVARVNLALCYPDMAPAEREALLADTLAENGMIAAEMGPMWGYAPERTAGLIRNIIGEDVLDEAIADPRGLILLAPHLGNWEIINNYIATKCPITIMYRPAKVPVFNNWMVARRENVGCKLVPTTRAGVKGLFDVLNAGGMIGFLPDQEPKEKSGVFAPFMGIETLTPKLPHEMLKKTGAIGIYGFAKRLPNAEGFDIYFIRAQDDLYDADARVSATSLNRSIEECIGYCPAQYQWTYKRFKRRPEGLKNPYKEAKVP